MCFLDLLPKRSLAETLNQASGYLADPGACLNTHIIMVSRMLILGYLMGDKGGPGEGEAVISNHFCQL